MPLCHCCPRGQPNHRPFCGPSVSQRSFCSYLSKHLEANFSKLTLPISLTECQTGTGYLLEASYRSFGWYFQEAIGTQIKMSAVARVQQREKNTANTLKTTKPIPIFSQLLLEEYGPPKSFSIYTWKCIVLVWTLTRYQIIITGLFWQRIRFGLSKFGQKAVLATERFLQAVVYTNWEQGWSGSTTRLWHKCFFVKWLKGFRVFTHLYAVSLRSLRGQI